MSKLSCYIWAWKGITPVRKSLQLFRKLYPDGRIYINVDHDGDVEGYMELSKEFEDTVLTRNAFQLGYCGDFGDVKTGRQHWDRESTFHWFDQLYDACVTCPTEYMILLEEDDFILKPITILDTEFSMAIHPTDPSPTGRTRPNPIPSQFKDWAINMGGIGNSPGYAAGGGTIFNPNHFIDAWDRVKEKLWNDFDDLCSINKIMGWEDFTFQFILMAGGYDIIQNHQLAEHWEVPEFDDYEIITGLKDLKIIEQL